MQLCIHVTATFFSSFTTKGHFKSDVILEILQKQAETI